MRITTMDGTAARVRRWTLLFAVVLGAAVFGPQAFANDGGASAPSDTYTVSSGETLWDIAVAVTAPGGDVSDTMIEIENLNAMTSSALTAGEQILIPSLD